MRMFIRPRLRKPAVVALAGTVFAAAWAVRGGPTWWYSIQTEVIVVICVIIVYVRGGQDSDDGARAGSRADERQRFISLRSRALTANFLVIAAFAGLTISVAVRAAYWPFAVLLAVAGVAYLLGLSIYGVGEEIEPADADAGHQVRSPVS